MAFEINILDKFLYTVNFYLGERFKNLGIYDFLNFKKEKHFKTTKNKSADM